MKPLNIRDPFFVLIILAISFFWWGSCEREKRKDSDRYQSDLIHQNLIHDLQARASTSAARIFELESDRVRMRDSARVAQSGLKIEIRRGKETIASLRTVAQPQIDTLPEISNLIAAQDAVILAQDSLITSLEMAHEAELFNLDQQLRQKGNQLLAEVLQKEAWRTAAESSEKTAKKERRKKGFWRTTTAILAGGVLFLTLQQ